MRRLEQLERIAVGIFQLDLLAARAGFHPIAETQACLLQLFDRRRKIGHLEDDPVRSARSCARPSGIGRDPQGSRTAQDQPEIRNRNLGKGRRMLLVQLEAQLPRMNPDRGERSGVPWRASLAWLTCVNIVPACGCLI